MAQRDKTQQTKSKIDLIASIFLLILYIYLHNIVIVNLLVLDSCVVKSDTMTALMYFLKAINVAMCTQNRLAKKK